MFGVSFRWVDGLLTCAAEGGWQSKHLSSEGYGATVGSSPSSSIRARVLGEKRDPVKSDLDSISERVYHISVSGFVTPASYTVRREIRILLYIHFGFPAEDGWQKNYPAMVMMHPWDPPLCLFVLAACGRRPTN